MDWCCFTCNDTNKKNSKIKQLKYYFCRNTNIMAASTVDKELIGYFMQLDEPQKKSLLEMMKTFLKPKNESLGPINIEQYNQELDAAMERINNGSFTTLEALEKEMHSW
jgi:late competence protein required for DNA uptake (superfamily II DNA/RNA helicase)